MRSTPALRLAILLAAGALLAPALRAQERDATVVPAGRLRLQVGPSFASFDRRFGYRVEGGLVVEEEEPLGFDFTKTAAGSDLLPPLAPLEQAIRQATGNPDARLTIGRTRVVLDASSVRLPIQLEVGILPGLQIGVNVPLVRRRTDVDLYLDSDSANVGLGDAAAAQSFLQGFGGALTATETRVAERCATLGEGSPECQAGRDLLSRATSLFGALEQSFGTSAGLLPLAGSRESQALAEVVSEIQDAMAQYGVQGFTSPVPLAAKALDAAALQNVLIDSAFGVAGDSLASWQSGWELGDVEVSAKYRFLETPLTDSAGAPRPVAYRGAVAALVRLGTGKLDDPANFVDVGTGDGQTDVELGAYNDLLIAGRFLASVVVRYGIQRSAVVERRISPPDLPISPAVTLRRVEWKPASYLAVDALPQLVLTPAVSVGFPYSYFTKGEDNYALAEAGAGGSGTVPSPDLLAQETESRYHRLGIGIVYSAPVGGGRLPFEARALYQSTVAGSGGRTLKLSTFQVEVRTTLRLWGR